MVVVLFLFKLFLILSNVPPNIYVFCLQKLFRTVNSLVNLPFSVLVSDITATKDLINNILHLLVLKLLNEFFFCKFLVILKLKKIYQTLM